MVEPIPFPFFVGCGRSGTTLLRAIFDSHSELAIPGESHFIVPMAMEARYTRCSAFPTDAFLRDLLAHSRFQRWGLEEHTVREALDESRPSDLADGVRCVYRLYARSEGKERYGDKTPNYVRHVAFLAGLLPETRFVHVIRDGRDVALSYLDLDWGPSDVATVARHWRGSVERGREAGRQLGEDRYYEVRYESLVADPSATVRGLCDFLDMAFEPQMLHPETRIEGILASVLSPTSHQHLLLAPTMGLRDWRQQMPAADVATFEAVAGDVLAGLGYELAER